MRRRLERLLPIVLLALVMQILAPIAASWAATITIADPLQAASICHAGGGNGSDGRDRQNPAHDGLCAACLLHAGAALDAPRTQAIAARPDQILIVRWPKTSAALASARIDENHQARGPPLSA
jgi:hypothetical protein